MNYFANFLYKTVKNYCVDNGIRNGENGFKNTNTGYQLENIVFLELLRRGYDVSEGRMRNGQIDFIASKNIETLFIQVTEKIDWEKTSMNYKREIGNLESIKINEPKIVLSLFDIFQKTENGIKIFNIIDWLLEKI